jgi:hypothetical protein
MDINQPIWHVNPCKWFLVGGIRWDLHGFTMFYQKLRLKLVGL